MFPDWELGRTRIDADCSARARIGADGGCGVPVLRGAGCLAGALAPHTSCSVRRDRDGAEEIGIIASVTQPFCATCTRARLSADGKLYTCLFSGLGHDFRRLLRSGATDEALERFLHTVWGRRSDRYSEIRTAETELAAHRKRVEMS